jgi:hypothetical protein
MFLKNPVTPPGIDPGSIRLNHHGTPGPNNKLLITMNEQQSCIAQNSLVRRECSAFLVLKD